MRKIRNLIGMPVICRRQKVGRLVQAELSPDLKRLDGIWVDSGLRGTRYIPAEHVGTIGQVAVLADNRGRRRRCNTEPLLYRAVSTDAPIPMPMQKIWNREKIWLAWDAADMATSPSLPSMMLSIILTPMVIRLCRVMGRAIMTTFL